MTISEIAAIRTLQKIANTLINEPSFDASTFVRSLTKLVNEDPRVREYVARSLEQEVANLQIEHPAYQGGDRRNSCFDGMFDFLRANRPSASGMEVFKSVEPAAPKKRDSLNDLLSFLK